jgi:group I intron endonuclease
MNDKIGYIYKITNPSGRIYIGKTININARISAYTNCKKSISQQKIIYNSILKYGWKSHSFEIIESTSIDLLNDLEKEYIKRYNSYHYTNPDGMNLTLGGDGAFGRKDSEDTKRKRADKHIGSKRSENTKKIMSELKKGKIPYAATLARSEKQIQHIKYGNIGRKRKSETNDKTLITLNTKLIENHGGILQYDKNTGELIKEWNIIIKEISKKLNIDASAISKCLSGKKPSAYNYIWKYKY